MTHIKFGEENRKYNLNRLHYFARKLLPKEDIQNQSLKVLDCGCGLGEFSTILRDKQFKVVCVDGNKAFIEQVKQKAFEGYVCDFEEEKLPFEDRLFNGVVLLDVIEHLKNPQKILGEIKRVLKHDGWFIISVPNDNFWVFKIKGVPQDIRHKGSYSVKSLMKLLKENGFKIEDYLGLTIIPKLRIRFLTKLLPNLLPDKIAFKCKL